MKNLLKFSALALALLCTFASCEKDPNGNHSGEEGVIILCEGSFGQNNATLYYNGDTQFSFKDKNGFALGDTAQDIIRLSKGGYCIAVYNSKILYFTDKSLKVTKTVNLEASPRCLAEYDGYVYVTLYEGMLAKVAKDGSFTTINVGPNPEGVAIRGGYAYVANSGGLVQDADKNYIYNNTVSKVDLKTFKAVKEITVGLNPVNILTAGNSVYVQHAGNYYTVSAGVEVIDADDKVVTVAGLNGADSFALVGGNRMYVLCKGYDESWNTVGNVMHLNTENNVVSSTDLKDLKNAYSINAGKSCIYLGRSDYKSTGSVDIYRLDDTFVGTYSAMGLNPRKVLEL